MTEPVRWGILGASRFAAGVMAPATLAARHATLAALAARDPSKAAPFAALAPGLRVHRDYDVLLADPEVDAVYVPLPNALHVEWGLRVLAAGKPVLVEKPVAMTARAIDPLIAARDRAGLVAAEAFMILHHPQWAFVRDLLAGGAVGRLRQVEAHFTYDNSGDPGNIRNDAGLGGGALADIGVYVVGATRWAARAEPLAVTMAEMEVERGCDTLARAAARFEGFGAHWLVSMRMARSQGFALRGTEGAIRLATPFNPGRAGEAAVTWQGADGVSHRRAWPGVDQYALQVEAFGAAVRGETPFPWTLEEARGTQAVLDAIREKAGQGGSS